MAAWHGKGIAPSSCECFTEIFGCLVDPCKKAVPVVSTLLPHSCLFAIFTAMAVDTNLRNASPVWFTEGWKYIGAMTILGFFLAAINTLVKIYKAQQLNSIPYKKKSLLTKLASEIILIIGAATLFTKFDKTFPFFLASSLLGFAFSHCFPQKDTDESLPKKICRYSDCWIGLLYIIQLIPTIILSLSVMGFVHIATIYLTATSFLGVISSLTLIFLSMIASHFSHTTTQANQEKTQDYRRELSAITENTEEEENQSLISN